MPKYQWDSEDTAVHLGSLPADAASLLAGWFFPGHAVATDRLRVFTVYLDEALQPWCSQYGT